MKDQIFMHTQYGLNYFSEFFQNFPPSFFSYYFFSKNIKNGAFHLKVKCRRFDQRLVISDSLGCQTTVQNIFKIKIS